MRIIHNTRLDRLTTNQPSPVLATRHKGYGLALDFMDGYAADARMIEKFSPVLFIEKIAKTEGEKRDRRRFGLVEYAGDGAPPKAGLLRYVADAFFADPRTAEFVWQACIEKIENDAAARK
ncbi:hypothetical protein HRR99_05640 [Agrobacterium vaccinii]|uniref:hypothetical protein n=1 Tax=Agrobacterium vaccinii TaxID=2735528 RepID=UPI001E4A900A|nr:hypothetical protein [Agrobacterium vaccinii]UHS61034.1 hypothetical protein HRR99_05640 [Agrobacterium vaccinii]